MATKKQALVREPQMGDTKRRLKVDIDGDGRLTPEWVRANGIFSGQSDQAFLNQLGTNINNSGWAQQVGKVPQMDNPDDLQGVIDGVYDKYGDGTKGARKLFSMFEAGEAPFDPSWQPRTSLRKDTGKTEERRIWDFSKQAWVVKEMKVIQYMHPSMPYTVGNFPVGSIVQVQKDSGGPLACGIVGDTGTTKAEQSPQMAMDAGIPINGKELPTTDATASITYLGKSSVDFPTSESIRSDCERLQKEWKQKQEEKKNKDGKKKKSADAQTQGGAFYLAQVVDHGVRGGSEKLLLAVADPSCLHSGGQPVCTGSGSIRIGVAQSPAAGEGDLTQDGYVIRKGTGDQTIEIT
jgi:hypothetical protein